MTTDEWPSSGFDLQLDLPPGGGRRAALERALRGSIQTGRLTAGSRLPSSRQLARDLGVARGTVRAAYEQLTIEGYLTARPGGTTTVNRIATVPPQLGGEALVDEESSPHDLRPGSPDVSSFPVDRWLRATRNALMRPPFDAFGYGDPRGRIELRTALAGYLGRTRAVVARPERLIITNGYLEALALICDALPAGSPKTVAMEDPGVELHRDAVERRGCRVVPLPVDRRGPSVVSMSGRGGVPSAIVVTPTHQYPSGVATDPDRRRDLVDWATATGGLVVEDDYDAEFRYDRRPIGALQGMAPDHVAYIGTTSKALSPAIRIGWIVAPSRFVEQVADAKRHLNHQTDAIAQLALADLISTHAYDRHIRVMRTRYRRRRDLLIERLQTSGLLDRGLGVEGVAAGLQILITLPDDGPSDESVAAIAAAHGVRLGRLADRWHAPNAGSQGIIVGYGRPQEHAYRAAVDALIDALNDALA